MTRKQGYKDWQEVIDKVHRDVAQREKLIIDMEIAAEVQTIILKYAEKRLKEYPKPKEKKKPLNSS